VVGTEQDKWTYVQLVLDDILYIRPVVIIINYLHRNRLIVVSISHFATRIEVYDKTDSSQTSKVTQDTQCSAQSEVARGESTYTVVQ